MEKINDIKICHIYYLGMSETVAQDPLLTPNESRYVMFPIQDNDIWKMYKKQVDCFWVPQEIDFSKDITDWNEKLNKDEKFFISMVLAFFAASDGIVTENLAVRFMGDVQLAEARAFYGFQIAMENIHCVAGNTKILTKNGYFEIQSLINQHVDVWNGEEFTEVEVKYTGNQSIFKVELSNGMELDCTSGHKWLIKNGDNHDRIETQHLNIGNVIDTYVLPVTDFQDPDEFMNPYMHGFYCGYGNESKIYLFDEKIELLPYFKYNFISKNVGYALCVEKYINKEKYVVPINYSIETRLRWLEGYVDAYGTILHNTSSIHIDSIQYYFLKDIQILLTTLGIHSYIEISKKDSIKMLLPKNDGTGEYGLYDCANCYVLYINSSDVYQLLELGFKPKRPDILSHLSLDVSRTDIYRKCIKNDTTICIVSIQKISDNEPTYCFNEPKLHTGIFNGILTGQSETYSIMIDTYIKEKEQQNKLFNSITNFPCIAKKATWAKKWITDNRSSFAARLIAFAVVEGIFFSASFASIYWLKKRGLLPGLTFSNELISRDEAMHCEFAVLLYSKMQKKLQKKRVYEIVQEAVEIEKEFITEAIPCRLIGMNSKLMCQYIEFVADRLCLQLGYDKIYNSSNPFDFMELISIESKVNFFERTNSEYALANKTVDKDVFDMSVDF
jgi:ribonucleotide reductase beta subunit family protein with ferritin-like domain